MNKGKRVLCVDDNQQICEIIENLLPAFEVRSAFNVTEAIALAADQQFELFILDIQLPDGDGFGLLSLLRDSHPSTPAIFITAASNVTREEVLEAGGVELIYKTTGRFVSQLIAVSSALVKP
jgi:DNA-binding response OmpR family regulator